MDLVDVVLVEKESSSNPNEAENTIADNCGKIKPVDVSAIPCQVINIHRPAKCDIFCVPSKINLISALKRETHWIALSPINPIYPAFRIKIEDPKVKISKEFLSCGGLTVKNKQDLRLRRFIVFQGGPINESDILPGITLDGIQFLLKEINRANSLPVIALASERLWSPYFLHPIGKLANGNPERWERDFVGLEDSFVTFSSNLLALKGLQWRNWDKLREPPQSLYVPESWLRSTDPPWLKEAVKDPNRRDLRHLDVISIDPPGCQDIDDAVHVTEHPMKKGFYHVGVHIADVSHFIHPKSSLDEQAEERAETCYHMTRVLPMLPPEFSSNLCSLKSDEDRLALSVLLTLTPEGELSEDDPPHLFKSIIRIRKNLSYNEVAKYYAFRDADPKLPSSLSPPKLPASVEHQLDILRVLTEKMSKARVDAGCLKIRHEQKYEWRAPDNEAAEWPSSPIQCHNVDAYSKKDFYEHITHSLIEELMVITNQTVARILLNTFKVSNVDSIVRRHVVSQDSIEDQLARCATETLSTETPSYENAPFEVGNVLKAIYDNSDPNTWRTVAVRILQNMGKAEYVPITKAQGLSVKPVDRASKPSSIRHTAPVLDQRSQQHLPDIETAFEKNPIRHCGLHLAAYTHFTSPIRRYPDLRIHQILTEYLKHPKAPGRDVAGILVAQHVKVCLDCSAKQKAHEDIERKIRNGVFARFVRLQHPKGYILDNPVIVHLTAKPAKRSGSQAAPHPTEDVQLIVYMEETHNLVAISALSLGEVVAVSRDVNGKSDHELSGCTIRVTEPGGLLNRTIPIARGVVLPLVAIPSNSGFRLTLNPEASLPAVEAV